MVMTSRSLVDLLVPKRARRRARDEAVFFIDEFLRVAQGQDPEVAEDEIADTVARDVRPLEAAPVR
jgi:hypothetical protein